MAIHKIWRKAMVKAPRRRRGAPLLPEAAGLAEGLSGTARRVNRVVAVVALFGAFGTVALALALTPEAQTSASSATAAQEDFEISRIEVPLAPVAAASMNSTVVAMQPPPEPAPKADRLFRAPPAPPAAPALTRGGTLSAEDRNAQAPASGATDSEENVERDIALVDMRQAADRVEPKAAREAADSAGRKLDEDGGTLEFGLSEPPAPPAPGETEDAALQDIEAAIEAAGDDETVEEIAEEPVEQVEDTIEEEVEEATPEVAATRTAEVTTDVNMRARPSNGAAVISVVSRRSTVEVIGCDYWCEVVYEGRRGWIYKGFVRGS